MEQIKSGENSTQEAFGVMDKIFKGSTPSIPEMKGAQHIRKFKDGTEIIMNRYFTRETMESTKEDDTISVNISNSHSNSGMLFVITKNGLENISIGKSTVSLRSHLYPRPNDNLRVVYQGSEQEKPLVAFRNASKILVNWAKKIVDEEKLLPCPVTIALKKMQGFGGEAMGEQGQKGIEKSFPKPSAESNQLGGSSSNPPPENCQRF